MFNQLKMYYYSNGKLTNVAILFALIVVINANNSTNVHIAVNKINTYTSATERIIEDMGILLPNNDTFVGKTFSQILSKFEDKVHAIVPGTRWCGSGNDSTSDNNLGLFYKTDKCCRAHDNCPDFISAGEVLGPLINNGIFTRSSCECDNAFYKCLKNVHSIVAKSIGDTYFNILRPQCFDNNYPIVSCGKYNHFLPGLLESNKCIQYKLDITQNKTLEWFDNPDF